MTNMRIDNRHRPKDHGLCKILVNIIICHLCNVKYNKRNGQRNTHGRERDKP